MDDTTKANYLGVSGIVSEDLEASEITRIQELLCRNLVTEEKRRARRYHVQPWQQLSFILTVPKEKYLITGAIKNISSRGLSFVPDHFDLLKNTSLYEVFVECSLRVGDVFLSPICRLVRIGRIIAMEFVSFPENEEDILNDYLLNSPFLERKMRVNAAVN